MTACLSTVCNYFRVCNVDVLDAVHVQSGDQMEPGAGRNITLGLQPFAIQEHHITLQQLGYRGNRELPAQRVCGMKVVYSPLAPDACNAHSTHDSKAFHIARGTVPIAWHRQVLHLKTCSSKIRVLFNCTHVSAEKNAQVLQCHAR